MGSVQGEGAVDGPVQADEPAGLGREEVLGPDGRRSLKLPMGLFGDNA